MSDDFIALTMESDDDEMEQQEIGTCTKLPPPAAPEPAARGAPLLEAAQVVDNEAEPGPQAPGLEIVGSSPNNPAAETLAGASSVKARSAPDHEHAALVAGELQGSAQPAATEGLPDEQGTATTRLAGTAADQVAVQTASDRQPGAGLLSAASVATPDAPAQGTQACEAAGAPGATAAAEEQVAEGLAGQSLRRDEALSGRQQGSEEAAPGVLEPAAAGPGAAATAAAAAVPTPAIKAELSGAAAGRAGLPCASPPALSAPEPGAAHVALEGAPAAAPAAPARGRSGCLEERVRDHGAAPLPLLVFEDKAGAGVGTHQRAGASSGSSRDPRLSRGDSGAASSRPRLPADQQASADAAPTAAPAGSSDRDAGGKRSRSTERGRQEGARRERERSHGRDGHARGRSSRSPASARGRLDGSASQRRERPAPRASASLGSHIRVQTEHSPMAVRRPPNRQQERGTPQPRTVASRDQHERLHAGHAVRGGRHDAAQTHGPPPRQGQDAGGLAARGRAPSRSPERGDPKRRPPPPVHFTRPHDEALVNGSGGGFVGPVQRGRPPFNPAEPARQHGRPFGVAPPGPQQQAAAAVPDFNRGFGSGFAGEAVQQGNPAVPVPGAFMPGPQAPNPATFHQQQMPAVLQQHHLQQQHQQHQQRLGGLHRAPAPFDEHTSLQDFGGSGGQAHRPHWQGTGVNMGGLAGGPAGDPAVGLAYQLPQQPQQFHLQQPQQFHSASGPPHYDGSGYAPQMLQPPPQQQQASLFGSPGEAPAPGSLSRPMAQPGLPPLQHHMYDHGGRVPSPTGGGLARQHFSIEGFAPPSVAHEPFLHLPHSRDPRGPRSASTGGAAPGPYGPPLAQRGPAGQPPAYGHGAPEAAPPPHFVPRAGPAAAAPPASPEEQQIWFYQDPKGVVRGPHSIAQFRRWLDSLAQRPDMREDYLAFRAVPVFKRDSGAGVPLSMLLG